LDDPFLERNRIVIVNGFETPFKHIKDKWLKKIILLDEWEFYSSSIDVIVLWECNQFSLLDNA